MKCIIAIVATLALVACNSSTSLDGIYKAGDSKSTLTFSGDKVTFKDLLGTNTQTTYHIDGKTVSFQFPNGVPASYTINNDGSLSAPFSSGYKRN